MSWLIVHIWFIHLFIHLLTKYFCSPTMGKVLIWICKFSLHRLQWKKLLVPEWHIIALMGHALLTRCVSVMPPFEHLHAAKQCWLLRRMLWCEGGRFPGHGQERQREQWTTLCNQITRILRFLNPWGWKRGFGMRNEVLWRFVISKMGPHNISHQTGSFNKR